MTEQDNTARRIVDREVYVCLSSLVSTLAKSANGMIASRTGRNPYLDKAIRDTMALCDRAAELSYPVPDYESAAREAGFAPSPTIERQWSNEGAKFAPGEEPMFWDSAEQACGEQEIYPEDTGHIRDVFEHWAISDWLADKLEAKGEKVDRDFAGMIVWARTTTGQAIYCDSVIQDIAAEIDEAASC